MSVHPSSPDRRYFARVAQERLAVDDAGRLIRSNRAFREIAEAIGADPYGLLHEHLLRLGMLDSVEVWNDLVAGKTEAVTAERRLPRDDPGGKWISVRATRGADAHGEFLYVLLGLDDVTERRGREEDIREANERLTQELATRREAEEALLAAAEDRRGLTQKILTAQEDERRRISIDWCEKNGIVPLGRFGHYDYHNSDQCVIASREMADRLLVKAKQG